MNRAYEEQNPFLIITKWLPCLFVPFLFLQAYAIGIRIYENGITPLRYIALAFLVFECICLISYFIRYEKMSLLLPVAAAIIFLCSFVPYINMNQVSFYSQKAVIENYLQLPKDKQQSLLTDASESTNTLSRIHGAYFYLEEDYFGKIYLHKLNQEKSQLLAQLIDSRNDADDSLSPVDYFAKNDSYCINVNSYSSFYPVDISKYYRSSAADDPVVYNTFLSAYPLPDDSYPLLTVDLYALFTFYQTQADGNDSIEHYFTNNYTYELDENHLLYMTLLSFTYDKELKTYPSFDIEGYILEK